MQLTEHSRQRGFSLLEMLVAISILGLTLGTLYQAVSGATRNVRTDERYTYSVELARSVLANNAVVPARGVNKAGETAGGFRWRVVSRPVPGAGPRNTFAQLRQIEVTVAWDEGSRTREVALHSVVEVSRR
jgi:general secretion pathway protein I